MQKDPKKQQKPNVSSYKLAEQTGYIIALMVSTSLPKSLHKAFKTAKKRGHNFSNYANIYIN